MAEKREHLHSREFHSCSARFVYPVSFLSLLIGITALVRIEIINQRVHVVKAYVAEAKQAPIMEFEFSGDAKLKSVSKSDQTNTKETGRYATEGKFISPIQCSICKVEVE